jgi:hypothetical protein
MTPFYKITEKLREHLEADEFINVVTHGDIFRVDLAKQTIFALAHIMVNTATIGERAIQFNVSIIFADLVDISKEETTDIFNGNDNEIDVLNQMLVVAMRLTNAIKRGSLFDETFELVGEPTAEPFIERFENNLAGWTLSFDLLTPNEISICQNQEN